MTAISNTPVPTGGDTPAPLLYSVRDAAQMLGLGRSTFCEMVATGEIPSVKVGRRRLIPATALAEYVASLLGEAGS